MFSCSWLDKMQDPISPPDLFYFFALLIFAQHVKTVISLEYG